MTFFPIVHARHFALAVLVITACKPPRYVYPDAGDPNLHIDSVEPNVISADEDTEITVIGAAFLPDVTLLLGTRPLTNVTLVNSAVITAIVPKGNAPGVFDLTVVNPTGDQATLAQALTVTPPDAGTGGTGGVGGVGGAAAAPGNVVFSVGVVNNAFAPPQSAPRLNLLFENGTASPLAVVSKRTTVPPTLDGLDMEWSSAPVSTVAMLSPGALLGLNEVTWNSEMVGLGRTWPFDFGITSATVQSMFDAQNIYFLVTWPDATENSASGALIYDADGGLWRRSSSNEDRVTLSFNINRSFPDHDVIGCTAACHVSKHLGNFDAGLLSFRRQMHTNNPGELADVWEWNSSTTNFMGAADDYFWDHLSRKGDSNLPDGGTTTWSSSNVRMLPDGGIEPLFMSMAGVNTNPVAIYAPDAGLMPTAVAYDGTGVVHNTTLPGMVHRPANPGRDDIRAKGRWANGRWTVEMSRARLTSDATDAQFPNQ